MFRKCTSIIMCGVLLVIGTLYPLPTDALQEELISGSAGDQASWSFEAESGVMTFYGKGTISGNYEDESSDGTAALEYKDQVKHIVIEDGITNIDDKAFYSWNTLETVQMADTVYMIGNSAFSLCTSLKTVMFSSALRFIGSYAFRYAPITAIDLPQSLQRIGGCAFGGNAASYITIPANVTYIGWSAFRDTYNDRETMKAVIFENELTSPTVNMGDEICEFFYDTLSDVVFASADFRLDYTAGITRNADAVYYAPGGGFVESYCKENGLHFVSLDTISAGDIDNNGLDTSDARTVLKNVISPTFDSSLEMYMSDVNGDKTISTQDARAILLEIVSRQPE